MMKYFAFTVLLFISFSNLGFAKHLKGGWIQYEYISTNTAAQTNKYKITVHQYMSCSSTGGQIDPEVYLGIFDSWTNLLVQNLTIKMTDSTTLSITTFNPCITPTPQVGDVCYKILSYDTTVDLPFKDAGYILAVQRCCRIGGIVNLVSSADLGVTYYNKIPGKILGIDYSNNTSPVFQQRDTVIVCHNTPFTFDFSATDKDADSLSYVFCNGLTGGSSDPSDPNAAKPNPAANPPYQSINYSLGFDGTYPMSVAVKIDPKTGLISGIAPPTTGDYAVSVCVLEYRNGVLIGTNKKEIHINVANCQLSAAELKPTYVTCNGYTLNFENLSTATNIVSYLWDFGVPNTTTDTSTNPTPTYTYPNPPDTGTYTLKLLVRSAGCADSATSKVKIFPGFVPDFSVNGYCYQNSFNFNNTTFAQYGFVDSVHWDFGEISLNDDTSILKNPIYKYLTPGNRTVFFYAHSSKGCEDTLSKIITVLDKPTIILPFKDTLICSIDTLQLQSSSNGVSYSWSPNLDISNTNIPNPLVYPNDTVTYILTVTDHGCINSDTIKVNVLDFITVDAGPNANVCLTDTFKMQTNSHALSYVWTPALTLNDSTLKYPLAVPTQAVTKYYVKANLGKCQDRDSVTLFTFPYPTAKASVDTSICLSQTVKLTGNFTGNVFHWSPGNSLSDSTLLSPIAKPNTTTTYIFTAQYSAGCLKAVSDSVTVTVVQPFTVYAGRDTSIVYGQPLQLLALVSPLENKFFHWTSIPSSSIKYLSDVNIQDPVATFPSYIDSVRYIVRAFTKEQCQDYDTIKIKIFKTSPDIFVPDAFTPNGDGINDVIRPIPVGITKLDYFNIYNRWGELIFTTSQIGKGWDGDVNGKQQASGTFIYTVKGSDYLGKIITKKGTVVLIR